MPGKEIKGDITALIIEEQSIQDRLCSSRYSKGDRGDRRAAVFTRLVMKGNIKAAMIWLDDSSDGSPLSLDHVIGNDHLTVRDSLIC